MHKGKGHSIDDEETVYVRSYFFFSFRNSWVRLEPLFIMPELEAVFTFWGEVFLHSVNKAAVFGSSYAPRNQKHRQESNGSLVLLGESHWAFKIETAVSLIK